MERPIVLVIMIAVLFKEACASCPPIEDSPAARLTYTYKNTVQVGPTSPLEEGTTATLKCHSGLIREGQATATCTSGKWNGLPLGVCTKQ
uniref:Sushi SCR CCP domain containing protein n=1 Tax=Haemonchus contortus TaxID=6289 RepID=W6N917_HAECO